VWGFDEGQNLPTKMLGTGTNWQNELFPLTAPMQNHSLTVSGGDAGTQYLFSLGWYDQMVCLGSGFKRYSCSG